MGADMANADQTLVGWKKGGCHCGAVTIEVEAPDSVTVDDCNCSICAMSGYLHLIVAKSRFRVLQGEDNLTSYRFNTGVADHLFCKTCGVKSFYVPRSHPDGISVNFRCLDREAFDDVSIRPFDGQHWEQNAGSLEPLA